MTKKHFIAIAELLNTYQFTDPQDRVNLACRLGEVFKELNPRFDADRFLKAVTKDE